MSLTGAAHWTQQFNKTTGLPYSGVRVFHYEPGGTTERTVWSDEAATSIAANPVVGDTKGRVSFYGKGNYRLLVKTSVADGDATLYDWDPVKLEDQPPGLRGELQATSYPSATSANRGLMFFKTNVGGDVTEVGVNLDASGFSAIQFQGAAVTATQQWARGADIASASTLTLGSDGNYFHVTGITGITAISAKSAGTRILLYADTGFTVTHNATSLKLWNAQDFTMAAGDMLEVISDASGNWYEVSRKSNNFLDSSQDLFNAKIDVSLAGNACTVSLKTKAGTDPSATDPVRVAFRSSSLTSGTYVVRTITSAVSMTISSGSTLGNTSAVAGRVWAALIDNAGTVEMAVWNPVTSTGLVGFVESALVSTTAEGGAGGADTAGVLYSTTSRSSVAMRLLGFFDSTQATAGTWVTTPTVIQTMSPGVPRTGDLVQSRRMSTAALATPGTTVIPYDDSIPQSGEGNASGLSQSIVPRMAVNQLRIGYQIFVSNSGGSRLTAHLLQDAGASAIYTMMRYIGSGDVIDSLVGYHEMQANTTSSTTFAVNVGSDAAGTTKVNGDSTGRKYGGVLTSYLKVEEIMA